MSPYLGENTLQYCDRNILPAYNLFILNCFTIQVRKELEVHGIEFYPQKEFDEDLEDKTENDKIRVGCS